MFWTWQGIQAGYHIGYCRTSGVPYKYCTVRTSPQLVWCVGNITVSVLMSNLGFNFDCCVYFYVTTLRRCYSDTVDWIEYLPTNAKLIFSYFISSYATGIGTVWYGTYTGQLSQTGARKSTVREKTKVRFRIKCRNLVLISSFGERAVWQLGHSNTVLGRVADPVHFWPDPDLENQKCINRVRILLAFS